MRIGLLTEAGIVLVVTSVLAGRIVSGQAKSGMEDPTSVFVATFAGVLAIATRWLLVRFARTTID